jgi:hypothetical protein
MSIGHKATVAAAKVLAATGFDLLTNPEFLKSGQDDFAKQLKGRTYKSMNDFKENPIGKLEDPEVHEYECAIDLAIEHFGLKERQGQR